MATVVLVHGAWAAVGSGRRSSRCCGAAGHEVHATTATGLGDRVHLASPAVDLDTHITDVVNLLEFEELTEVTLVGWSYGGMIITGVAEWVPDRLAGLVYLDALVPADQYPLCASNRSLSPITPISSHLSSSCVVADPDCWA